jgi:hypothetical protein
MSEATPQPPARDLVIGDRIRIQQGLWPIPAFLGQLGTVVEIFRLPLESCRVRVDGDLGRDWFFYRDEVVVSDA